MGENQDTSRTHRCRTAVPLRCSSTSHQKAPGAGSSQRPAAPEPQDPRPLVHPGPEGASRCRACPSHLAVPCLVSQRLRHLSDQFLALKAFSGAHLIDSVLPGGLEVQARGWDRERPAWPPRRAPHGAGRAEQPLSKPLTQEEGESARWVGKGQAVPAPSPAPRTEPAGRVGAGGVSTLTVLQLGRH